MKLDGCIRITYNARGLLTRPSIEAASPLTTRSRSFAPSPLGGAANRREMGGKLAPAFLRRYLIVKAGRKEEMRGYFVADDGRGEDDPEE